MTGNDHKWYHVRRNDRMITSDRISAKKHIVGVSLNLNEIHCSLLLYSKLKDAGRITNPPVESTRRLTNSINI